MKLLNYRKAIIDLRKLREYCLNPEHPVGKHKAHMFKKLLGIGQKDALYLKEKFFRPFQKRMQSKVLKTNLVSATL